MRERKETAKTDATSKIMSGRILRKVAIVFVWLLLWQLAGMLIGNPILFATPLETVKALLENFGRADFWGVAGMTLLRIGAGFFFGMLFGILLAALSKAVPFLEELLHPLIYLMKTVPVVCFVVLFLIWWGSSFLSIAISFLMVFTAVYFSTLEGLKSVGKDMLEMAQVYRLPLRTKLFYLYRPALEPFLMGSLKTSLGFAWKSGVAAEVIGLPSNSIGERIYLSKISLDTAGIFAWTVVVCVMSAIFEKLVLFLVKKAFEVKVSCKAPKDPAGVLHSVTSKDLNESPHSVVSKDHGESSHSLIITNLSKSYGGQEVLKGLSMAIEPGETEWLTWPSGAGKTTLFRLLAGLEPYDEGSIDVAGLAQRDKGNVNGAGREIGIGYLFQEDRLCNGESALRNLQMVTGSEAAAREALQDLLEEELWDKPCGTLSGGERRRVALARALAAKGRLLLLDEPFAGLDEERVRTCWEIIQKRKGNRTLLIASHLDLRAKK